MNSSYLCESSIQVHLKKIQLVISSQTKLIERNFPCDAVELGLNKNI